MIELVPYIGYAIFATSYLVQIRRVIMLKQAYQLSMTWLLAMLFALALLQAYFDYIDDLALMIGNGICLGEVAILISLKLHYDYP